MKTHLENLPCKIFSPYGNLPKTKDKNLVTCKKCLKIIKLNNEDDYENSSEFDRERIETISDS